MFDKILIRTKSQFFTGLLCISILLIAGSAWTLRQYAAAANKLLATNESLTKDVKNLHKLYRKHFSMVQKHTGDTLGDLFVGRIGATGTAQKLSSLFRERKKQRLFFYFCPLRACDACYKWGIDYLLTGQFKGMENEIVVLAGNVSDGGTRFLEESFSGSGFSLYGVHGNIHDGGIFDREPAFVVLNDQLVVERLVIADNAVAALQDIFFNAHYGSQKVNTK